MWRWIVRIGLACVLASGLGYLPYRLYRTQGLINAWHLERDFDRLIEQNKQLRKENQILSKEIHSLKHDRAAIERVARDELGMIRPNDIIFLLQ